MKLSEALVLAKTKVEAVDQVRNLNLWGNGLTDVEVRWPVTLQRRRTVESLTLRRFSLASVSCRPSFPSCPDSRAVFLLTPSH